MRDVCKHPGCVIEESDGAVGGCQPHRRQRGIVGHGGVESMSGKAAKLGRIEINAADAQCACLAAEIERSALKASDRDRIVRHA